MSVGDPRRGNFHSDENSHQHYWGTSVQRCHIILKTDEISMGNMIHICTDGAPSIIGKRKGFISRLIGNRNVFTIHCVLHRENFIATDIGNRDLFAILQTVVSSVNRIRTRPLSSVNRIRTRPLSSVNRIRTRPLQYPLFLEACRDENFHRLAYSTEVRSLSIGSCLARFVLLLDKVFNFCKRETLF